MQKKFFLDWDINGNELIVNTNKYVEHSRKINNIIKNMQINTINDCDKLISMLSDDITEYTTLNSMFSILQYVSPSKKIRKSSYISEYILSEYKNEINIDSSVYDKIDSCYKFMKQNAINRSDDIKFLVKVLKSYIKNGVNLSSNNKQRILKVKYEIIKIENNIASYINGNDKIIGLTDKEIIGLSKTVVDKLPVVSNNPIRYGIQLSRNNYTSCMRYIKNPNTRKNLELCYDAKCYNIIADISRLVVLRDKYAKLLGYNNYFEYMLSYNMINDKKVVKRFMNDLLKKLDYHYVKEIDTLIKLNKNRPVNSWDINFLVKNWKKEYGLNDKKVKEYFLLKNVINEIFSIYSELFDIQVKKHKKTHLWHNDVTMYAIIENGSIIGYFYMDLLGRDNKYKGTRCFPLRFASKYPADSDIYQIPTIALIASFNKNSKGYILLNFSEVISLFHEFSHILHHIFGKNKYIIFSSMNVERDFVETPAHIMEYLCWEKDIIKRLSRHYITGAHLEDDTIHKLIKIRDISIGIHYKKHVLISIYDQYVNSSDRFIDLCEKILIKKDNKYIKNDLSVEFASLYKKLYIEMMGPIYTSINKYNIGFNNGIILPNVWIDGLSDNNTSYYVNILSKVNAGDIYYNFRNDRKRLAIKIKEDIFKVGGYVSARDIVTSITNKNISPDGFIRLHGLNCDTDYSFFFNTSHFDNPNNNYSEDSDSGSYTNRFSEIEIDSASPIQNEVDKLKFLHNRVHNQISANDEAYITENTESLNKYNNIFTKYN